MAGKKKRKKFPVVLTIVLVLILAVAGWGWSVWVRIFEKHPVKPPDSNSQDPVIVDPVPEKNIMNVLVLGIDQIKDEPARADTIIVMSLNEDTGEVAMISIPRDARVEIPGRGMDKINHAMAYRGELQLMISTVEKLLGVPMHHYVYTNFAGFTRIVDALGGVTVNVEKRMIHDGPYFPIDLQAGRQKLNGSQALGYVRYRGDGDFNRMRRQQEFLKVLATETLQVRKVLVLPQLMEQLARHVRTDMTIPQLLSFTKKATEMDFDEVHTVTLLGRTTSVNGVSYVAIEEEQLADTIRRYLHWEDDEEEEEAEAP